METHSTSSNTRCCRECGECVAKCKKYGKYPKLIDKNECSANAEIKTNIII
jgi:hypothetical protein